jgi:hypothetical protein
MYLHLYFTSFSSTTMEKNWDNYIFDDGNEVLDLGDRIPDERRIDKERWLSKKEETRLALLTAIESIADASTDLKLTFLMIITEIYQGHYSGRCKMCQKIDISSQYGFGHYRYPALEHSAALGCPLCEFFLVNINKIENLCSADLTIDHKICALWYKHAGYPAAAFELFKERGEQITEHFFMAYLI